MPHQDVQIETQDGICSASLSVPSGTGPWPAVLSYSDAGSLRDTTREMGERLSSLGYVVLVPDMFYRSQPYEPFDMRTVFDSKESMARMTAVVTAYSAVMLAQDAKVFVDYLDSLPVTTPHVTGTTGYCLGGKFSLRTAATLGDRIKASASFHGSDLGNPEDPASPYPLVDGIKAAVYVGEATDDRTFPAAQKERLEEALTGAQVEYTIETYEAHHGFAVPDTAAYDAASAERHWEATEHFFGSHLGK